MDEFEVLSEELDEEVEDEEVEDEEVEDEEVEDEEVEDEEVEDEEASEFSTFTREELESEVQRLNAEVVALNKRLTRAKSSGVPRGMGV